MATQPIVFLTLQTFEGSSNAYRQKLSQMRQFPQCRWLLDELFLKSPSPHSNTSISLIDNHDGHRLEENTDLESMLKSASLRITTRIVVLVHNGPDNVDRDILDKICSAFDIDPLFVMSHFYWYRAKQDQKNSTMGHPVKKSDIPVPISLPSLVDFLSLDINGAQFSAIFLSHMSPRTGKPRPQC